MKIRIKNFNGELPSYLTFGKKYKVTKYNELLCNILDDEGDNICILLSKCGFLNGGDWEIVKDDE